MTELPKTVKQALALIDSIVDPPACSCKACVSSCESRAGWMTPDEALAAIEAGYARRLMKDWWVNTRDGDLDLLGAAECGWEGERAPFWPGGRCTFLTAKGLCEIHASGFKSVECRKAYHSTHYERLHGAIAKLWDTAKGKAVLRRWRQAIAEVADDVGTS